MASITQGKSLRPKLVLKSRNPAARTSSGSEQCPAPRVVFTSEKQFFPESPKKPEEEVEAAEAAPVSYLFCKRCKDMIPHKDILGDTLLSFHPGFLQRHGAMNWSDESSYLITCNCGKPSIYHAMYTCINVDPKVTAWKVTVELVE